jgi:ATP-binding cassette subfamily C protein
MDNTDLQPLLCDLFKELGMFAQANYVLKNKQLKNLDVINLIKQLKKHQVVFSVLPITQAALSKTNLPFVILNNNGQSSLVKRSRSTYLILDEKQQWVDYQLDEKNAHYQVIVIDSLPLATQTLKAFTTQMSKRTKWYKPVFWLSLLSSLTGLAVPLFTMSVYDRVIGGQAPDVLPKIALGAFLALTVLVVTRMVRAKVLSSVSNRFARDLSDMTFTRLLNLPLLVLSRVGVSNHIARMRNAEKVRSLLSGPGGAGLVDLPFTLIAFATITFLSGWLVLIPIVMLMIYALVNKLMNHYVQAASPTMSSQYQNSLNELSNNILQLQASGHTAGWTKEFFRQTRETCRQNFLFAKRNGLNAATANALGMLTALATVFTGIFLVLEQSITAGALIACVMLIWRITGPAQLAFSSRQKFTMMDGSIKQFDRFMQASTENSALRLATLDETIAPTISFNHVTLRYSAEYEPALSAISVEIEAGECVAVIGPNGCGKTSLLMSALGVIEPQSGFITINDKHLKQFDPEQFRRFAAFVPAESELLQGSLADNLRIVKPDASDEELVKALISAGGESLFNALGKNLSSDLSGQSEHLLSAVEANYIGLARALLKKSPYMLLDEPLANRNPLAKIKFIETLQSLKGKSTVLFSSHDTDLIKLADKVIILDKGNVVFAGPIPENTSTEKE